VRVIAATSVDLKQLTAEGKFRADLYYRLNVLPIVIPPLRERLSDLDALCDCILEQIAMRTGQPQREITPTGINALSQHDWPGNIRELRNVLERAVLMGDHHRLTAEDFASILPLPSLRAAAQVPTLHTYAEAISHCERATFRAALDACDGNIPLAAKKLGIGRTTLYKKLRDLGLVSS
jgi:DNA-binding NtrC family response regulator